MMYSYCTLIMYDYNHHHYLLKCTAYYDMGIENLKRVRKGLYCGSQTIRLHENTCTIYEYNTITKASPTSSLNLAFQFSVPEAENLK